MLQEENTHTHIMLMSVSQMMDESMHRTSNDDKAAASQPAKVTLPIAFSEEMAALELDSGEMSPEDKTIEDGTVSDHGDGEMKNVTAAVPDKVQIVYDMSAVVDFGKWSDDQVANMLESASYCSILPCDDKRCKMGKQLFAHLQENLMKNNLQGVHVHQILRCLQMHSQKCVDSPCPVPYCTAFYVEESYDNTVKKICEHSQKPCQNLEISDCNSKSGDYHQLCKENLYASCQKEHENWECLSATSGKFGTADVTSVLAAETGDQTKLLTIQNVPFSRQKLAILVTVSESACQNISQLLWAKQHDHQSKLLICSSYLTANEKSVMSLKELIEWRGSGRDGVEPQHTLYLLAQILNTCSFLHKRNVVLYLWAVESVHVVEENDGTWRVKIWDFSAAKMEGSLVEYSHFLPMPVHSLPIELARHCVFEDGECVVLRKSDIWSIACLVQQLLTGQLTYHQHRHINPQAIRQLIANEKVRPQFNRWIQSLGFQIREFLGACWKKSTRQRKDVEQLLHHPLFFHQIQ